MAFAHEAVIGLSDRAEGGVPIDSEDCVRILGSLLFHADVVRPDAGVVASAEAEMPGDLAQIGILVEADPAVGEGDMEQPAEQIFEHPPVAREQTADLAGIALE